MIYEKTTNRDGVEIISYTDDNGVMYSFAANEANSDYQAYLRWLNGDDEASGTL